MLILRATYLVWEKEINVLKAQVLFICLSNFSFFTCFKLVKQLAVFAEF